MERATEMRPLRGAVESSEGGEERRGGVEHELVHGSVDLVRDRHTTPRPPSSTPFARRQVAAIHLVAVESRRTIGLEVIEGGRLRELQFRREQAPVIGREALGDLEDPRDLGRLPVARQVDAGEPEAAGDRDLLRGELQEERPALVGRRRLTLDSASSVSDTTQPGTAPA